MMPSGGAAGRRSTLPVSPQQNLVGPNLSANSQGITSRTLKRKTLGASNPPPRVSLLGTIQRAQSMNNLVKINKERSGFDSQNSRADQIINLKKIKGSTQIPITQS